MPIQLSLQPVLSRIESIYGPWYRDTDGNKVIDLSAQTLNLPFGQPPKEIRDEVIKTIENGSVFFSSRFGSEEFDILAECLIDLSPNNITNINHKLSNGTDAVETALKISFQNQRTQNTLVLRDAWHGESFATLPLSSNLRSSLLATNSHAITFSESNQIDSLIELAKVSTRPSTVIIDPIGFSRGLFEPHTLYENLSNLRDECQANGHILIFDEIQCFGGFLGSGYFSKDVFGVDCDIITIGKALGQGFPVAACLYDSNLSELQYNEAEFTYGGQPPACSAAIAGLKYTETIRHNISDSYKKWLRLVETIRNTFSEHQVRQIGFFCVVDFSLPNEVSSVFTHLSANGVYARKILSGAALAFKCPLTLDDEAVHHIEAAFKSLPSGKNHIKSPGELVVVEEKENKNERYVNSILSRFSDLHLFSRKSDEQIIFANKLKELGIPSTSLYNDESGSTSYEFIHGVSLDKYKAHSIKEAKQIYVLLMDWIKRAHENHVVLGDRWSGNTVWDGNKLTFIDFDLGYEGTFHRAACFEHFFAIFHHANIIPKDADTENFLKPFILEFFEKWEKSGAIGVADQFCEFYSNPRKSKNDSSLSIATYQEITRAIKLVTNLTI